MHCLLKCYQPYPRNFEIVKIFFREEKVIMLFSSYLSYFYLLYNIKTLILCTYQKHLSTCLPDFCQARSFYIPVLPRSGR